MCFEVRFQDNESHLYSPDYLTKNNNHGSKKSLQ